MPESISGSGTFTENFRGAGRARGVSWQHPGRWRAGRPTAPGPCREMDHGRDFRAGDPDVRLGSDWRREAPTRPACCRSVRARDARGRRSATARGGAGDPGSRGRGRALRGRPWLVAMIWISGSRINERNLRRAAPGGPRSAIRICYRRDAGDPRAKGSLAGPSTGIVRDDRRAGGSSTPRRGGPAGSTVRRLGIPRDPVPAAAFGGFSPGEES